MDVGRGFGERDWEFMAGASVHGVDLGDCWHDGDHESRTAWNDVFNDLVWNLDLFLLDFFACLQL